MFSSIAKMSCLCWCFTFTLKFIFTSLRFCMFNTPYDCHDFRDLKTKEDTKKKYYFRLDINLQN